MNFKQLIKKLNSSKKPLLAVLIDPDKFNPQLIQLANKTNVACFLVGGSDLKSGDITETVRAIKKLSSIPVVLFPGSEKQLVKEADGLLLLSLLSGNNPDYLIGKHISAAPIIKEMKLSYLPTAYLLINGGTVSATQIVTQTQAINPSNTKRIVNTALAAEQLGFKAVYLEAGSGAKTTISGALIKKIKNEIALPIIVGGGITSKQQTQDLISTGVNMIVVGNALEKNVFLLSEISACF